MAAISIARKVLPRGHLHSYVRQSHRARSHRHGGLQKFVAMQMIDVLVPTIDARELRGSHALHPVKARTPPPALTSSGSNCRPSRRRKLPARRPGLDS